jgi:hypothetical protein
VINFARILSLPLMETMIPSVTKCAARSLQLHLAKGMSKSVGLLQAMPAATRSANAVTCALTIASNKQGRPGRGASSRLRV